MEVINVLNYFSIFLLIIYAFVISTLIRGWARINRFERSSAPARTSVSIIIAARNEEDKIGNTIDDILAQDFDKALLEVIIIDDHSTDATADIVRSYESRGISLIQLNESSALNSYKKKAIQTAIGTAKGELIVTTDADCRMGPRWLSTIVNYYETYGFKMISSPVAYFEETNFLEYAQSLEFSFLIGLGASTIGNKSPSTCNGANLAYQRDAFYEVGGFKGIDDLASGDDELLLHKIAAIHEDKIGFLKNLDAVVYTHAKPTVGEFIQQRKRWASKSTRYKEKSVIILGVSVWLFNLSILVNLGMAIIFPASSSLNFLLVQLVVKLLFEGVFLNRITSFFKRKVLLVLLPIVGLLHVIYVVYIGIAGNSGHYKWKDRVVR